MFTYQIMIEPQEEWGFTIWIPSFPWCISEWETIEEAMINIQEAAELYLKTLNKKRKKIPLEQSFNNITIDSKKVFEYA